MPIVIELIVLSLAAYGVGFSLGWLAWGRPARDQGDDLPDITDNEDTDR